MSGEGAAHRGGRGASTRRPAGGGAEIESLARGLRLLDAMWGGFALGMTPGEVAEAAKESPSYATRALRTFEAAGWAERLPETKRWRATVRLVRHLQTVRLGLEREQARLAETAGRIETAI